MIREKILVIGASGQIGVELTLALRKIYGNANVVTLLSAFGSNIISSTNNITTTANISGNYFIGNGSQLTDLPVQPGNYNNSNVVTLLGAFGSNTISSTGNITTTANISGNFFRDLSFIFDIFM
jgi:hypothetical protein